MTIKIFVYGTLLKKMGLSSYLMESLFLGHGIAAGVLYDLGGYPGLVEGTGAVYGELYEINENTLKLLDQIEGYSPENSSHSLYIRKEISVQSFTEGSFINAYSYFYNHSIAGYRMIACGDYRRDQLEQQAIRQRDEQGQWYIAYGSNMDSVRLKDRLCMDRIHQADIETGYLEGYALRFNKAANQGGVYANIAYQGLGHRCPFVAYRLAFHQIERLDQYEGEPLHYVRVGLPFPKGDGSMGIGHVYIAHVNQLVADQKPSADYWEYLRRGYQEHGFHPEDLDHFL